MILDFGSFVINESSLKKLKKDIHGVLHMSDRKRMRKELRDNIITFKFRKRDGSIRTAHGTLHPDYLPPLKGGGPRPEKQMVYYDLDKEGWRSFRSYSFIKILNIKPVDPSSIAIKPHTKPSPKPVSKSAKADDEDEEIKKTTQVESDEEQEVKKPVPKKKESEDEEEHEYKSPIYDESEEEKKEREEDDEKIEKIKHKDKEEPEEDTKEDKDKDKEKDEEKKSEDE